MEGLRVKKYLQIIFNNFSIFHQILQSTMAVREDRGVQCSSFVWPWEGSLKEVASTVCHTSKSTVCLSHCCAVPHCTVVCHELLWCSASTMCLKHCLTQVLCSASSFVCHTSTVCQKYYCEPHKHCVPHKYYCVPHKHCVPHSLSSLLLPLCAAETWPVKWRGAGKGFLRGGRDCFENEIYSQVIRTSTSRPHENVSILSALPSWS